MTISVVIPAYNEETRLPRTLNSLRHQTRKPDEIIVVDNNSTDTTARVARRYGAKTILVKKKGVAVARQAGLKGASGEIVAFTDADAVVPPDWIETITNAFSSSDIVALYGNYRLSDGPRWFTFYANHMQGPLFSVLTRLGIDLPVGANMAMNRSVALAAGGFPVHYKMVEDNEIIRRIKTRGRIIYLGRLLVSVSGRRGREGAVLPLRYAVAFLVYSIFGRGDIIGFKDFR